MSANTHVTWEAFTQPSFSGWWSVREKDGFELGSGDGGFHESEARMMAAAPDLLSALQGVLHVADRQIDEFDAARAAIAKATGAA